MLHTLFPKNYRRYERSNCAEELKAFGAWLMEAGYSRENTCGHLHRLRSVLEGDGEAVAAARYSGRRLAELFSLRDAGPGRVRDYRATRRVYQRFLASQDRFDSDATAGPWERCLEDYAEFLREVRGFAPTTIAKHLSTVLDFLSHALDPTHPLDVLSEAHVERHLSMKAARVTRQSLQHTVAHLRAFLRYGFEHRLIPVCLDTIDTPRVYRGERPPRAIPWPLVLGLLRSIDRSDKAGWRDYAILHLMAHYGLRPSEIVALEVGSVDFATRTLRVEQRKTASELLLPLADPTLRVLCRYLQRGRPDCDRTELFLRVRRPTGALRNTAVCDLFAKRNRQCGLPPGRYSAYSLRHAFAMRLLERGVGVKAIAAIVPHRSGPTCGNGYGSPNVTRP